MKKRLLAVFLTVCMLLTLLSVGTWARADDTAGDGSGGTSGNTSIITNSNSDTGGTTDGGNNDTGSYSNGGNNDTGDNNGNGNNDTNNNNNNDHDKTAWITRADLPQYAADFYEVLVKGSDNDQPTQDVLTLDSSFNVNTGLIETPISSVKQVQNVTFTAPDYLTGLFVSEYTLAKEEINTIDPTIADESIDYGKIHPGDVVKTSSFNGIYVTSVVWTGNEANFTDDCNTAKDNIFAAAQFFEWDHPEVFWLSGETKDRFVIADVDQSGETVQKAFFFYVLAESGGFSVRDAAYAADGAIQAGIEKRNQAIEAILATVPESGTYEQQISALNKWLTQHNEYNTSADLSLSSIGTAPHRCLGALTGSTGTKGPVCEGYSKAFKVLCDRLYIPCILEMGYARSTPSGAMGMHMWNSVYMPDGKWYGADITWDDPPVAGNPGALSGEENENYLLVGPDCVIQDMCFALSHQAETSGIYYTSPILSATLTGGKLTANFFYDGANPAKVCFAFYSTNGRQLGVAFMDLIKGESVIPKSIFASAGTQKAKIFVLDANTCQPYCACREATLTN